MEHHTVGSQAISKFPTMAASLCGQGISSRRSLLASLWFLVSILTAVSFLAALIFAMSSKGSDENGQYYNNYNGGEGNSQDEGYAMDPEIAVTSRALVFSALWTAVLSALMSVFGTVILGWQSPLSGQYYTCCTSSVHKTTPLGLGSFIGALLMFANLTLICSTLFGEFEIRDYREGEDKGSDFNGVYYTRGERSSMAFSVMCMFLTVLYAGFAALTFAFANGVIEEHLIDDTEDSMQSTRNKVGHFNGYDGYIGERFDVGRTRNTGPAGFVSPTPPEATLT